MTDGIPDTPDAPRPDLDPNVVSYTPHDGDTLRCDACGVLVDENPAATDLHSVFHAMVGQAVDGLGVRLARVEEALAGNRIAPAPAAGRPSLLPPTWGATTDRMVDSVLAEYGAPPGYVCIVLYGTRDQVGPAAAGLGDLVPLEPACLGDLVPLAPPVHENRVFLLEVDAIRSQVNRFTAALADARAVRSLVPPAFGAATDHLVGAFLDQAGAPPGHVRIILDGPRDQVVPAAAGLGELVPLEPIAPIMRGSTPPVQEQRAYVVAVDDIRNQVNRFTAALAGRARPAPARIPGPDKVSGQDAAQIARHARAILLHLGALEGVAIHAGLSTAGEGELADLLAEASLWVKGLDTWAESTAHKSEVPRELYAGADQWCHRRGGELPFGDLDGE